MLSCAAREETRAQTLENLGHTDWHDEVSVELDPGGPAGPQERQQQTSRRLLERALSNDDDYVLFLEDDLDFNLLLRHNLEHWLPLLQSTEGAGHFFASLYNPNVAAIHWDRAHAFLIANPRYVYGSQAFLVSIPTVEYLIGHWNEVEGMQDIKMSRIAGRVCSIYYHVPSLVQHVGRRSSWGGRFHWSSDFSSTWRAARSSLAGE